MGEVLHAGLRAGLAGIMSHARSHAGMAGGDTGMLLHATRMRRKRWSHACHHSVLSIIHRVDIDVDRSVLLHATAEMVRRGGTELMRCRRCYQQRGAVRAFKRRSSHSRYGTRVDDNV